MKRMKNRGISLKMAGPAHRVVRRPHAANWSPPAGSSGFVGGAPGNSVEVHFSSELITRSRDRGCLSSLLYLCIGFVMRRYSPLDAARMTGLRAPTSAWTGRGAMLPTPVELREQSRLFRKAADEAVNLATKRRLAAYALAVAQIAEKIEREEVPGEPMPGIRAEHYQRLLAKALDEGRRQVAAQPKERRADPTAQRQVARWRARAEELRTTADEFTVPSAQESLRRAAANYERLADEAEALLTGHPCAKDKAG
jgi:hypothetical protein